MDVTSRLAMVLRICEMGTSSYSASSGAHVGAGAATPSSRAFSTSRLTIRPPGPEPLIRASAIPASSASRRASGEALMRSPSVPGAAASRAAAADPRAAGASGAGAPAGAGAEAGA